MIILILIAAAVAVAVFAAVRKMYDRHWSEGLRVDISFADEYVFEGENTTLLEVVSNHKNLPLPAVEIDFNLDRGLRFTSSENSVVSDKLYRRDIFALASNQKITRHLEMKCAKRGYYTLLSNGLTANDIFLTKKYVSSCEQNAALYVYPERIASERISIPFNRITGEVLSRDRLYEDPFEFGGIRDYMISDPMKYINWKASAKSGDLVVNLHDSSLSQQVCIILDTGGASSIMEEELSEEAIRITASLSQRVIASGIRLTVVGNGRDTAEGSELKLTELSGGSVSLMNKRLSRISLKESKPISEIMSELVPDSKVLYVLVSKDRSPECRRELVRLAGNSRSVWIYPYTNELIDVENSKGMIDFIPWAVDVRKAGKEL